MTDPNPAPPTCTLNEQTLQEILNFISESRDLPPNWTMGRVIAVLTRAQTEIAKHRNLPPQTETTK